MAVTLTRLPADDLYLWDEADEPEEIASEGHAYGMVYTEHAQARLASGPDLNSRWIWSVEVKEEHRGKGFGRKVMQRLIEIAEANGVTKLGLYVYAWNTPAINLYESLGFVRGELVKPPWGAERYEMTRDRV